MRIGELAKETGTTTKTIRFYESIGVLPEPPRAPNGYREYGEDDVERLRFVRDAQATGLTLDEIASVLSIRQAGQQSCRHVIHLLEHHLDELDEHIRTLRRTRKQLASLTERAKALDPAACTDPVRCQTIEGSLDVPEKIVAQLHRGPQRHAHG